MQPPQPPQHRLPVFAIVGAAIGAVILLALAAVVVHALASTTNTTPTPPVVSTSTPVPAPTTPAPISTPTAQTTTVQTGTPTVQPTAGQTGTPAPVPSPSSISGGQTVETNTWKATLPSSSWKVTNQKNASAELDDPNGDGFIYINAGTQSPPQSTQQVLQSLVSQISGQNQGVKECDNGAQAASIGTPPIAGTAISLCYNVNNQNGQAVQVVDAFWIGTTDSGAKLYSFEVFGPQSAFNTLGSDVNPIIKSIQWKSF